LKCFSGKHVRLHIFYPISTLQIESKGYGIKLATACALNKQGINEREMSIDDYYFLFCLHITPISRYSLEETCFHLQFY